MKLIVIFHKGKIMEWRNEKREFWVLTYQQYKDMQN